LARYLVQHKASAKLQPDHKALFKGDWDLPDKRLAGVRAMASDLAGLVNSVPQAGETKAASSPSPRRF
jgi:transcription-repair coupling factor (superfamily II helicase)